MQVVKASAKVAMNWVVYLFLVLMSISVITFLIVHSYRHVDFMQLTELDADASTTVVAPDGINISWGSLMPPSQVSLQPLLQLHFTQPVVNLNAANLSLHQDSINGTVVPLQFILASTVNDYFIAPAHPLAPHRTYYLVLGSAIEGLDGREVATSSLIFRTNTSPGAQVALLAANSTLPLLSVVWSQAQPEFANAKLQLVAMTGKPEIVNLQPLTTNSNYYFSYRPVHLLQPNIRYALVSSFPLPQFLTLVSGPTMQAQVQLSQPLPNQGQVSRSPELCLDFNQAVDNVTTETVTLHRGSPDGIPVALAPITSVAQEAFFTQPQADLEANTTYFLVLSNAISLANGSQLAPTIYSFTTGTNANPQLNFLTTGAGVISRQPLFQFQASKLITIRDPHAISLHQGQPHGAMIPLCDFKRGANFTFNFHPCQPLLAQRDYYLSVADALSDEEGNLNYPTSYRLHTDMNLAVETRLTSPTNNNDNVALQPNLELSLNSYSLATRLQLSLHEWSESGPVVPVRQQRLATTRIQLQPLATLQPQTNYVIVVKAPHMAPFTLNFITRDLTLPQL